MYTRTRAWHIYAIRCSLVLSFVESLSGVRLGRHAQLILVIVDRFVSLHLPCWIIDRLVDLHLPCWIIDRIVDGLLACLLDGLEVDHGRGHDWIHGLLSLSRSVK